MLKFFYITQLIRGDLKGHWSQGHQEHAETLTKWIWDTFGQKTNLGVRDKTNQQAKHKVAGREWEIRTNCEKDEMGPKKKQGPHNLDHLYLFFWLKTVKLDTKPDIPENGDWLPNPQSLAGPLAYLLKGTS